MQITYFASDDTMGDTSPEDCAAYRRWAQAELEAAYPEATVEVTAETAVRGAWTDAIEREEEIEEFCARLWERCPWTW